MENHHLQTRILGNDEMMMHQCLNQSESDPNHGIPLTNHEVDCSCTNALDMNSNDADNHYNRTATTTTLPSTDGLRRNSRKDVAALDRDTVAEKSFTNRSRATSSSSIVPNGILSHQPQHHHLNPSMRMEEVASIMREQDAELLESIHRNGPNQSGMTPHLTCATASGSQISIPILSLLSSSDGCDGGESTPCIPAEEPHTLRTLTESSLSLKMRNLLFERQISNDYSVPSDGGGGGKPNNRLQDFDVVPDSDQTNQSNNDVFLHHRALSGVVFQQQLTMPSSPPPPPPPPAVAAQLPQQQPSAEGEYSMIAYDGTVPSDDGVRKENDLLIKYNESTERRICEAAQFAEAVGDLPLEEQEVLRIIDDDREESGGVVDDDDDEDDNATEIHVERRGIPPPQKSSQAVASTSVVDLEGLNAMPPTTMKEVETPIKSRGCFSSSTDSFPHPYSYQVGGTPTASKAPPSASSSNRRAGFLAQLPSSMAISSSQDFVYKGINANPPEIVKRGTTRGNYALLHRKAWLEVSDKYHRYGKHLRIYYRHWESLGCPTNMFFDWLDSKGEAAGKPLPELEECPRSVLDSDTVLYITNPEVTERYALQFVAETLPTPECEDGDVLMRRGRVVDVNGEPVQTGPDGWIFILRDNVMYGAEKVTSVTGHSKQRFHHSSFFGGKAVAAAGIFITDDDGYLTRLYPHSGHYRPGEAHMQRVLFFLYHQGVDLRTFDVDTQQIVHVTRDKPKKEKAESAEEKAEKKKKVESLHLMPAVEVACFLAHKARFIGDGIFAQIHRIRKGNVTSVTEALALIDGANRRSQSAIHEVSSKQSLQSFQ
jgi:hypothetical protein